MNWPRRLRLRALFEKADLSLVLSTLWTSLSAYLLLLCSQANTQGQPAFFDDDHTVALWLFDETAYYFSTLCDAGRWMYDLTLMPEGTLSQGKFGNCLSLSGGTGFGIMYTGFKGKVSNNHLRLPTGKVSGLWHPTEGPEHLLNALASDKWTIEFWLKADGDPGGSHLINLGQGYQPGFALSLNKEKKLHLDSAYGGYKCTLTTKLNALDDKQWHHLALCYENHTLKFFLDGLLPTTCARKFAGFRTKGSASAAISGPSLLFNETPEETIQIGRRKHLFIDVSIVEKSKDIQLTMNPPVERTRIRLTPEYADPERSSSLSPFREGQVSIIEHPETGEIWAYAMEGYNAKYGGTFLFTSKDGIHFKSHPENPLIDNVPQTGSVFYDRNPSCPADERFKMTCWVANLGICLYVSQDGIHWRRNESLMLPLTSGGDSESYYDDQKGKYFTLLNFGQQLQHHADKPKVPNPYFRWTQRLSSMEKNRLDYTSIQRGMLKFQFLELMGKRFLISMVILVTRFQMERIAWSAGMATQTFPDLPTFL